MAPGKQRRASTSAASTTTTAPQTCAPGKRAATDALTFVKSHPNEIVEQAGYQYRVMPDGGFTIVSAPPKGGKPGAAIPLSNRLAWDRISKALIKQHEPSTAADAAATEPCELPAKIDAPADVPVEGPSLGSQIADWFGGAKETIENDAKSVIDTARAFLASTPAPAAKASTPAVAPAPIPDPATLPAGRAAVARAFLKSNAAGKKPMTSTLERAESRLSTDPKKETHYKWEQAPSAPEKAAIDARKKEIVKLDAVIKDPLTSDTERAEATATRDELTQQNKAYDDQQTNNARQASGSDDANTFWCSGFVFWTVAAAGYDSGAVLTGDDGHPFKYKTKKNSYAQSITLKALIDGGAPEVEAMIEVEKSGQRDGGTIEVEYDNDHKSAGGGHIDGYAKDGTASTAVKGAAGAFVLFGIGTELPNAVDQKPGDFAQARTSTNGLQAGDGHAWQVDRVTVIGDALFGATGSPVLVGGTPPTTPTWLTNATFTIDSKTTPALVGRVAKFVAAVNIEANKRGSQVPGSPKANDPSGDGGVQLNNAIALDGPPTSYTDRQTFYGRLNTSPWASWQPATAETALASSTK